VKLIIGLILIIFGAGIGGAIASPDTKYEVIHRDHYKTKTVIETKTERIVPQHCLDAIHYAEVLDDKVGAAYATLFVIDDIVSELNVNIGVQDLQGLIGTRNRAHRLNNQTRTARKAVMVARADLRYELALCQEELEDE
jgi:hypothetical protein